MGDGCYCFLLSQQTGADSRTAYLSAGIPQPHQRQGQEGRRRRSTVNSVLQNSGITAVKITMSTLENYF